MTSQRVDLKALKRQADFPAILAHYGLTAEGRGNQIKILCPFHAESRASCSINVERRLFHCFGCDASGNALDFVHRMEALGGGNVSLREAGLKLAAICNLPTGAESGSQARQKAPGRRSGARTKETASRGAHAAPGAPERPETADQEQGAAKRNKPLGFALTLEPTHPYLTERGVAPALVELFGLGFCSKGSMAGRIAIPIRNVQGELVAYAGRWVGDLADLPEGEDKYKLPKGFAKTKELFNLHRVKRCRHLVVVEGYFGAIRLHGLRMPTVALMGSSIAEEQIDLLLACPALRFLSVLTDGDEPGREAAGAITARLARHWWTRTLTLPEETQPDTVEESLLLELVRPRA